MIKYQERRHICVDFEDGGGIGIATLEPVDKFIAKLQDPKAWKNGIVPKIVAVYEAWW